MTFTKVCLNYSFDRGAADKVGEVTSCTEQQMVEFANLAKTAYGATSSWSSVQVTYVGVHVGMYR